MENWYKIDNAGKIFPSVKSRNNTAVFRVAVVLDHKIKPEELQKATDVVAKRFPVFMVKLRKGVFWNYLEKNKDVFSIQEESEYPCKGLNPVKGDEHLLRVLYYNNRIAVEFFHALTDGYGGAQFLKSLVYYYLKFCGFNIDHENKVLLKNDSINEDEYEDSFKKYSYQKYYENISSINAKRIKGKAYENKGFNVVHGLVSVKQIRDVAKKYNTTITGYLIALMLYSMNQTVFFKDEKHVHPSVVAVPVNLRKPFTSKTLRNFFGVINIGEFYNKKTTFDSLIKNVNDMLLCKTQKPYLQNIISSNVELEQSEFAKITPLVLKKWLVSLGFKFFGEKKKSITLSNLGVFDLPKDMLKYIKYTEMVMYPTPQSPINCAVISSNDNLNITFTRSIVETDLMEYFFSYMSKEEGMDIEVYSNDWRDSNDV